MKHFLKSFNFEILFSITMNEMKILPTKASLRIVSIFVVCLLCTVSCKDKKTEDSTKEETVTLPEDFLQFYDRFHSDFDFQISRIIFPLEGKLEETGEGGMGYWHADDWTFHRHFSEKDSHFKRAFSTKGNLVIEIIADASQTFSMERRWAKLQDGWSLIYYRSMEMRQ